MASQAEEASMTAGAGRAAIGATTGGTTTDFGEATAAGCGPAAFSWWEQPQRQRLVRPEAAARAAKRERFIIIFLVGAPMITPRRGEGMGFYTQTEPQPSPRYPDRR